MGIAGGPSIIEDGLILALDASDSNSYVSGSTTWKDLTRNGSVGTLVSCSFNSINSGCILFNGSTGSVSVTGVSLQDLGGTISTWVYPYGTGVSGYIVSAVGTNTDRYYVTQNSTAFSATRGNPSAAINFTTSVTPNQWYNLTATWVSSSLSSSLNAYLNGAYIGSVPITASGVTTEFAIGNFRNTLGQVFSGSIASVQVYNRALSAQEVLQNYNATKTRFSLT